jgi:hypothetical protein
MNSGIKHVVTQIPIHIFDGRSAGSYTPTDWGVGFRVEGFWWFPLQTVWPESTLLFFVDLWSSTSNPSSILLNNSRVSESSFLWEIWYYHPLPKELEWVGIGEQDTMGTWDPPIWRQEGHSPPNLLVLCLHDARSSVSLSPICCLYLSLR